jgi:hypothetical protein
MLDSNRKAVNSDSGGDWLGGIWRIDAPLAHGSGAGDQIVFEGAIAEDNSQLRVTSRVVNSDGLRIWSERFETNRDPQGLLNISARIASALISRVCPEQPLTGKLNNSAGASTPAIHS